MGFHEAADDDDDGDVITKNGFFWREVRPLWVVFDMFCGLGTHYLTGLCNVLAGRRMCEFMIQKRQQIDIGRSKEKCNL